MQPISVSEKEWSDCSPAENGTLSGREWIIDARGCDPSALRDVNQLSALFTRLVAELALTPVLAPVWHTFPSPGGVTGFVVLAESHVACHTFPEFGSICVNVFCCKPRPERDLGAIVTEVLGATATRVCAVQRSYAAPGSEGA